MPIIPDEARTFGMDPFFRPYDIYSSVGQLYDPVDAKYTASYREAKDGQILEEGITEAGSMSSFIAAGTAYATHGVPMIPFFIYYSMFGFQRIGDLIWAAADMRCRGFLLGATAGRTTLNGEGLQHEDGHSHVLASTVPNVVAYDPAFAYELAVIIQDGIRRMYEARRGRLLLHHALQRKLRDAADAGRRGRGHPQGPVQAQAGRQDPGRAEDEGAPASAAARSCSTACGRRNCSPRSIGVPADVWSVTSYKELRREALECERWNLLHPTETPRQSYLETVLAKEEGVFVAASDLHEVAAGDDPAVGAGRPVRAGHRRLRPQRRPRGAAAALRGRRRVHHGRGPEPADAAAARSSRLGAASDQDRIWAIDPEKVRPGARR